MTPVSFISNRLNELSCEVHSGYFEVPMQLLHLGLGILIFQGCFVRVMGS